MVMTTDVRKNLRGKIIPHSGQEEGEETATGNIRTDDGVIIVPHGISGQKPHAGVVANLTDREKEMLRIRDDEPAVKPAQKATRKKTRKAAEPEPEEKSVIVDVGIGGLGSIKSQCRHCYRGKGGVVVLGLGPLSYRPNVAEWDENDNLKNTLTLSVASGLYFFAGEEFTDKDGVVNIILHRVPEVEAQEDDDDEKDQQ